ncbi:UNVERIFIED_CONTAM: hypothetical protein GTU68_063214 [Idotea baltica]|nr:hypothetical protein [Idotea baltica]
MPIIGLLDKELKGIELETCPLHFAEINNLAKSVRRLIPSMALKPYDAKRKSGELKGILISANSSQTELMLRFVIRSKKSLKTLEKLTPLLLEQIPQLKVVSANIQPTPHQILEGDEEILLSENSFIWQKYNGLSLAFAPGSFMQVTPEVAEQLYAKAAALLQEREISSVADLFCGAGGFLFHAAQQNIQGLGFELDEQSLLAAKETKKMGQFDSVDFSLLDLQKEKLDLSSFDALVCNPPRRGIGDRVIESLRDSDVAFCLYSSCNPETLLSDIAALEKQYSLEECHAFDMFPLTQHLEVLALLKRR